MHKYDRIRRASNQFIILGKTVMQLILFFKWPQFLFEPAHNKLLSLILGQNRMKLITLQANVNWIKSTILYLMVKT